MKQSVPFRILSSFTKAEFHDFLVFAKSEWVNDGSRPKKLITLLSHVTPYHPDFNFQEDFEVKISKTLFKNKVYDQRRIDKLLNELTTIVRKYIVANRLIDTKQNQFWQEQISFFRLRGLKSELSHAIQQLEKLQGAKVVNEGDFYLAQFKLESEKFITKIVMNDNRSDLNLAQAIRALDAFYIATKLEYCSYMLTKGIATNVDYNESFLLLNEVLHAANDKFLNTPFIALLYYYFLIRMGSGGEADYESLKLVLAENQSKFSFGTIKGIHSYLRNYVAEKYNSGDAESLEELHTLNVDHFEKGTLFLDEGKILASTVQNAITVALKIGEVSWAMNFLEANRLKIVGADDSEAIYQFNLANCYFNLEKFGDAEQLLGQYNFKDVYYKLAARRLEIKLYYETKSPLLDARLDAFKVLVHEMKRILPVDKIGPNNAFVDILRQILSAKTLGNDKRIGKIREKLIQKKAVAEREWLQEKIHKMMGTTLTTV